MKTIRYEDWDALSLYLRTRIVPLAVFALFSVLLFILWFVCCCCCIKPKCCCRNPTEFELVKDTYKEKEEDQQQMDLKKEKEDLRHNHDPLFYIEELDKRDKSCSCRRCSFIMVWIIFFISLIPIIFGIISLQ